MKVGPQATKWMRKKMKGSFRGFPVGTVAFYGPDDRRASKVAVGIITKPHSEPSQLRRWFCQSSDIRRDSAISEEVARFLRDNGYIRFRWLTVLSAVRMKRVSVEVMIATKPHSIIRYMIAPIADVLRRSLRET